jgi:lysophospholipase L1-like esterase
MGFDGVIIVVGSNDIVNDHKFTIAKKVGAIMTYITHAFPTMKLGIAMIIPRPVDEDDTNRRAANKLIRAICKAQKVQFLNAFKGVNDDHNKLDETLYAKDKIHLNYRGIIRMRRFLIGASAAILEGTGLRGGPQQLNTRR